MQMPQQQPLELLDIYDVSYDPWWLNEWLWYCIYVALGTALCVGIYLVVRKYIPSKKVPYWQKSMNQIHALNKKFDDPKQFYLALTDILKHYLQERYTLPLVGKTDIELLQALEHDNAVAKSVYHDLHIILEGIVTIKFAHGSAALEQMQKAQKTALKIVQETRVVKKN